MNTNLSSSAWSEEMRRRIEQKLEAAFSSRPQTELLRAARYVVQGGGHRWRGLMAMAAGCMFHQEAETHALPLSVALEIMHSASLVLDDLPSMDNAQTRRGKACVHLVFPGQIVDMLPAFLVNMAYQVFTDYSRVPEDCRIRTLLVLGEMGADLARGQELDLALADTPVSEMALLECYALKSGSPFAAALAGGGLVCGAGPADAQQLCKAGLQLGQAYQILDDIADGPSENGEGGDLRPTALSLFGAVDAQRRAQQYFVEAEQILGYFGPVAGRLRELLNQILSSSN